VLYNIPNFFAIISRCKINIFFNNNKFFTFFFNVSSFFCHQEATLISIITAVPTPTYGEPEAQASIGTKKRKREQMSTLSFLI